MGILLVLNPELATNGHNLGSNDNVDRRMALVAAAETGADSRRTVIDGVGLQDFRRIETQSESDDGKTPLFSGLFRAQIVGLIPPRAQVQVLPPQPTLNQLAATI